MIPKEQIAHDLAVARMAGKQLPTETLIEEYEAAYKEILKHLKSQPVPKARILNKKDFGL